MGMEEALIARLSAAAAVAAVVGDRISWFGRIEGDPLPALTLLNISPGQSWTHSGPDGVDRPRVRFDCYAATDVEAIALKRAVIATMTAPVDIDGWRFHPGMLGADRTIEEPQMAGGTDLFHQQIELQFYHEEL